jgi:glycosyltransferase involved in cell wall biosynthesis
MARMERPDVGRSSGHGAGSTPADGSRIDLCLVAHLAWGALSGGTTGHVGGVERQTSLMARWLASQGHHPSLVTWDEGQRDGVLVDGVRVVKACAREAGLPVLRFLHPRWTSLNRALARANAGIYYHNCSEYVTGQVALWARRHDRRFVFSTAHDEDTDPRLRHLSLRERLLYRYGLRHADTVIAQTRLQQTRLREHFGRESVVVPMPCPGPGREQVIERPARPGSGSVLWIGRVCEQKRPHLLLELARACPEVDFDLVGPADASSYTRKVLEAARSTPNIKVRGSVARPDVPGLYLASSCLVCTSRDEGFPNTFLEAWSHGLPVVSTFDPDSLIAERGLGRAADGVAELAASIRDLLGRPEEWQSASQRARKYYLDNHTIEAAMSRFESVFLELGGGGR